MLAARLLLVLILLAVCSFAPGFFLVRRYRWSPLEKLCGSVGLSLILAYLAAWAIYVLAPSSQPAAYFAVSAICAVLAVLVWRDLGALWRIARVRQVLAGFGFLLVWSGLMLATIRVSNGAAWAGDWVEHFKRSLFFLQRFPLQTAISPGYLLPARPPLMNVLAAFFLGQAGDRFEVFQVIFLFLNLLPFLACCLLAPALAGPRKRLGKRVVLALAGIFAMSPVIMESATYAWTKALSAFFVILALSFYLAGLRKGDSRRIVAAFLALAAGLLTHYSAGPYVAILTVHYLFTAFRKRGANFKELGTIAALCGALLFTWFGWSLAVYGAHTTFAANTSVADTARYRGSNLEKIAGNLFDSVVPAILRDPALAHNFDQPNPAGVLRDNAFIVYQTNLIFGMGAVGGPLVVCLLVGVLLRKRDSGPERSFWLMLVPAAVVLGIAVVGERDPNGVAHLTLLPMEMLGLTWLGATFCLQRWAAWLILAGSLVDFPLGVLLHARMENLENRPGHTVFAGLSFVNGSVVLQARDPDSLSQVAWRNWYFKHQYALARESMSALERDRSQDSPVVRSFLQQAIGEDRIVWQGWFSRHGGAMTYLGDYFGEGWIPSGALLAAWLALLWTLWRNLPPAHAAVKAQAPKPRRKSRGRNK